jgi:peptidoglycan/LPS O-acetylase OafA/YrhL
MSASRGVDGGRVAELDLLRFFAAAAVMVYHWTYRPVIDGAIDTNAYGALQAVSRYGYLGVDLFFLISGFVIFWSASNRSGLSFLASRLARLYPSFWVSVTLTLVVLWVSGRWPAELDARSAIAAYTMVAGAFGFTDVDGVYWTLLVEIKLYLVVFLARLALPDDALEALLYGWLAIVAVVLGATVIGSPETSLVWRLARSLSVAPYAPLFIAGGLAFVVREKGLSAGRAAALGLCFVLASRMAVMAEPMFASDLTSSTRLTVVAIEAAAFAALIALALRAWSLPPLPIWGMLGALTYPLYLLHNQIGKALLAALPSGIGNGGRLLITTIAVAVLAWVVVMLSERRACPAANRALQRVAAWLDGLAKAGTRAARANRE